MWTRRKILQQIAGASVALPFFEHILGVHPLWAQNQSTHAKRIIIFYFPDGVPAESQAGDASLWHVQGQGQSFQLPDLLSPLQSWRDQCVFLNGLTMGPTDSGSHPGGAKKLLTAVDGGMGESIDQYLARTVGNNRPHRHIYLGAMAQQNQAGADRFISYVAPGQSVAPQDNPLQAFTQLFAQGTTNPNHANINQAQALRGSVIDAALEEIRILQGQVQGTVRQKLDRHLDALRQLEQRIQAQTQTAMQQSLDCQHPQLNTAGFMAHDLYNAQYFPALLRTQIDLMVLAMQCGLSQVGVVQASQHTSELIMSRFENTAMYDAQWDMRSHQASHYGASHNWQSREFSSYVAQRKWFVEQFAYLLSRLAAVEEDGSTMLDHSIVLLCTEVCDGNTHLHDNMPFIVAGGAGGRLQGGRVLNTGYTRHSHLLTSLAHACGDSIPCFGQACMGPLTGLLS